LRFQIQKRAARPMSIQPEFTQVGDNKIIGSTSWLRPDGSRQERYQVLTLRGDKIADIQGCTSKREAERFARRRL
jgi:hypothetical protein